MSVRYNVKDIFFGRVLKITGVNKTENGKKFSTETLGAISWCVLLKKKIINKFKQLTRADIYKITNKEDANVGEYILDEKSVHALYPIMIDKSKKYLSQDDIETFQNEMWQVLNRETRSVDKTQQEF